MDVWLYEYSFARVQGCKVARMFGVLSSGRLCGCMNVWMYGCMNHRLQGCRGARMQETMDLSFVWMYECMGKSVQAMGTP